MRLLSLLLLFFLITSTTSSGSEDVRIYHSARQIDEFVVSRDLQTIYVASVNRLTSLSLSNLSVKNEVALGPVSDSPWCSVDGKSCLKDHRPSVTDVRTKILQLLPGSNQLLHCGSVKLGSCSTFNSKLSLLTESTVPVASNSPDASTVSLLLDNRLIVAAEATKESPYRDPFPAVAMRTLPSLMVENAGDLEGEAAVFLRATYRNSFRFIDSFAHEHFIFVVATVQSKDSRTPMVTKLIRFCRNDTKFVSYSEIELQCRGEDNTNYPFLTAILKSNDKLIASFATSSTSGSSPSSSKSSICAYSMQRVKLTFWYNVDRCRSGTDSIKLPHIGRDAKCVNKAHIPLDEDSCELGVGGSIELVEMSMKDVFANVTSLMAVDQKAVFAGTSESQIVMLKWEENNRLEEYGRKDVGDSQAGSLVMKMIRNGDSVIVQMPNGIILSPLSTCSHYGSCSECLQSMDPLCQWCHPTQTCTISSKCQAPLSTFCPLVEKGPIPSRIALNSSIPIEFKIRNLPKPDGFSYRCEFGSAGSVSSSSTANWTETGLVCKSALLDSPNSKSRQTHISVITSISRNPISTHNLTVYNCGAHETCSTCMSSEFECQWCLSTHQCAPKGSCGSQSAKSCVKLHPMKIPISLVAEQEIVIEAENLDTLDRKIPHFCKILGSRGSKEQKVPAKIASDSIRCGKLELNSDVSVIPLTLMAQNVVVDIANVSLYSCSNLASDCSSCLALSPSLSCGWCNRKCSHSCHEKSTICDPPRIDRFEPLSGPIEGGTIIKIYGNDLGMSVEDVKGKIYVAGSRCNLIDYQVSNYITCQLDKGSGSGPVKISVGRVTMAQAESKEHFSFVRVSIFSAYPLYGPKSGGTKITLYGQNLNLSAGSKVSVSIGGKSCSMIPGNSSSVLSCQTPPGAVGKSARIIVHVDHAEIPLEQPFEYRSDPEIASIFPMASFKAGGKLVNVIGTSLNTVQSAKMYLLSPTPRSENSLISDLAPCHIINSTMMTCMTPRILDTPRRVEYTKLPIGFMMDNVTRVQNLESQNLKMTIYPNPVLSPFKGVRYHQGEQSLILEGHNLNLAAEPNDFKIFIGNERCYVTLVDVKQLVCSGPLHQPKPTDERGVPINGFNPLVTVIVGSLRQELGLIEYSDQTLPSRLSLLILGLLLFILITLIIMCFLWKRRRQEREKEYRKIQLQMENLENNVRKECKQAFAELQTNLVLSPKSTSTMVSELQNLLSFPHFVENLLWSDSTLATAPSLTRTLPVTLAQFHALLSFKPFIFTIVEAAESDCSISTSERSILASLLISVLLRNFSYCTEIMVELLRTHISKAVANKRAELLFRNSDSVVEKMFSKWMSICLFSHLTPQMNAFFYLYKALQYQTDKGPVDAVTGDARYTINESRLLRESVDSKMVKINIIPFEKCEEHIELDVHACDAICQLKQKVASVVYRETPYSQRPRITQFELKFKCPRRGEIKLTDVAENDTLSQKKLPIKLLTVADYGIQDGAVLEMSPAVYMASSFRNSLADSGQSSWSSLDRCSSPIYSSTKYYHLTNPTSGTMTFKKKHDNIPKSIPEVYLTRLLTSKGTVETYVEDFLEAVLYMHDSNYPPILKFFFDILDKEAASNGVSENICQQWKANGYVLRVWANFVRNPQLVFDLPHSISMEANLSTVAQTMMDCFSFSEPVLGAHSPSSRLLFAKDVARLRPLSVDLFKRVKNSPPLGMDELRTELVNMANDVSTCKGSSLALSELLSWVRGNGIRISQLLQSNEEANQQRLPQKLSQVLHVCLETDNHIYSTISDYD